MPVNFVPTGTDYLRILPEIIMTIAGTLIMLIEGWLGENKKRNLSALTFVAFVAALVAAVAANGESRACRFRTCSSWTASPRSSACW